MAIKKIIAALVSEAVNWAAWNAAEAKGMIPLSLEVNYIIIVTGTIILICLYWSEIRRCFDGSNNPVKSAPHVIVQVDSPHQKSAINHFIDWFDNFKQGWAWAAIVLLGIFVLLSYCQAKLDQSIFDRQWHHSYLSEAETQKAENGCQMKAYEVIGGDRYRKRQGRQKYIEACMESRGFFLQND